MCFATSWKGMWRNLQRTNEIDHVTFAQQRSTYSWEALRRQSANSALAVMSVFCSRTGKYRSEGDDDQESDFRNMLIGWSCSDNACIACNAIFKWSIPDQRNHIRSRCRPLCCYNIKSEKWARCISSDSTVISRHPHEKVVYIFNKHINLDSWNAADHPLCTKQRW